MAQKKNIEESSLIPLLREEFQILGILLQYPEKIDDIADRLEEKHFYHQKAALLYSLILEQYQEEKSLSRTRFLIRIKEHKILGNTEDLISQLTSGFTSPKELDPAVELILEHYQRRKLHQAALRIVELTGEMDLPLHECLAEAQELIFSATTVDTDTDKHIYTMEEALMESFQGYVDRKHKQVEPGLQTGFISLDNLIGGFKTGHLTVLAGATSMGKTAFAINMAANILRREVPVAIISLEMDACEICDRMIIQESSVHGWKFNQGETKEEEDHRIADALDRLHHLPLLISDQRGLNVSQIRARLRRFKAQLGKLGLIIVDYLQLINISMDRQNTARAVGEVVLQLRNMASEMESPILLLSQLSRSYSTRPDKRPLLSDLRDSGNIEEIADGVIFIFREAQTGAAAREKCKKEGTENHTDIIVAKQRTGQTGSISLIFEESYIRFLDPVNSSLERSIPHE